MDERCVSEAAEGFAARYVATHFATKPELHCMRVGFAAGVEWHRQQAAAAELQALRDIAKMRVVEDLRNRDHDENTGCPAPA